MALLELRNVTVNFGGLAALSRVSFDVEAGCVTGLIGPNGAGKTTCFNVVAGLQPPAYGDVSLDGRDITRSRPHRRARLGIGRTFQRLETFRTLTVRENVLVAAEVAGRRGDRAPAHDLAEQLLERVGVAEVADEPVEVLPTGTQRLVEVARALAIHPRVLLLDEPSSGLDEDERDRLTGLLTSLSQDDGLAVLLVEHDVALIMSTCRTIHVLDFGRLIATGTPEQVRDDPAVREAYLGDGTGPDEPSVAPSAAGPSVDDSVPAAAPGPNGSAPAPVPASARVSVGAFSPAGDGAASAALALRDVRAGYGPIDVLHGVSLTVPVGCVVAVLGPNGAGKTTLLKAVSGELRPSSGTVHYQGRDVTGTSPERLARDGLCTIPEGRGIFPNLTVAENLLMSTHTGTGQADVEAQAFARFPGLRDRRSQVAGTLSGGEQQMLALARALATDPRVILLDELSMGLAPLIVEELYRVVADLAAGDISIVVVEQFAHDVLAIADHAVVMVQGRVALAGPPTEVAADMDAAYLGLEPA